MTWKMENYQILQYLNRQTNLNILIYSWNIFEKFILKAKTKIKLILYNTKISIKIYLLNNYYKQFKFVLDKETSKFFI